MSILLKNIIVAIFAISFSVLLYFNSLNLPPAAYQLPRILIVIVIILSLLMIYEGYIKSKNKKEESIDNINYKRAFVFALLTLLYIVMIKPIGYFIATPLYIIIMYLYLKSTNIKNIFLIAAGFTLFIYYVFIVFLKVPIPLVPII